MSDRKGKCAEDFERLVKASEDRGISEVVGDFTRRIDFEVGYDHRGFKDDCGGGGHGQRGMQMRFILIGELGAVQWLSGFSAMVPGNVDTINDVRSDGHISVFDGWDLGYHWNTSRYEGMSEFDCEYTKSGHCYYDGSGLAGGALVPVFLAGGPHAIWTELENYYNDLVSE